MLIELKVSNFAIIDEVNVFFKGGFNVLSGETGSGKSVLLKSLGLLMGDKAPTDTIKTGSSQASVEGHFDVSKRTDIKKRLIYAGIVTAENESQIDNSLIVKRIISADGKNRIYINGSLSSLQQLRDIVSPLIELTGHPSPLIELTGQHENRHLQSRIFHLESLDQYIGGVPRRSKLENTFHELENLSLELRDLESKSREKSQRLDFLIFQRDEIKSIGLKPGDDEALASEIRLLKDSSRLSDFISGAESALYSDDDSALVRIHRVIQKGQEFSALDPDLAARIEILQQAKTLIEESVYDFREYAQKINTDPNHLEQLEFKLSSLRKVQKKYGSSIQEILTTLDQIEGEIETLENSESRIEQLQERKSALQYEFNLQSEELHKMRLGGAETLAKSVNAELEDLNMKGLIFSVRVQKLDTASASGYSDVEFMIQSSKADSARSLAKFASGGELSRILLSLKRVVGISDLPRTYLFDEVDAGVSGVTAEKVGRKLKSIAKGQQVICVTHLPQVAAFAHAHYVITKSELPKGGVSMSVSELDKKAQINEIARMLSGEKITKSSLEHAKELLSIKLLKTNELV